MDQTLYRQIGRPKTATAEWMEYESRSNDRRSDLLRGFITSQDMTPSMTGQVDTDIVQSEQQLDPIFAERKLAVLWGHGALSGDKQGVAATESRRSEGWGGYRDPAAATLLHEPFLYTQSICVTIDGCFALS